MKASASRKSEPFACWPFDLVHRIEFWNFLSEVLFTHENIDVYWGSSFLMNEPFPGTFG
jgi:hypothetical protein